MTIILYKQLSLAVDKTIDTGDTTYSNCNTNYRITLSMFCITSWCKPLKTHQSREIGTYATGVKPLFAKCTP